MMLANSDEDFEEVLSFWLGPLDAHGRADEAHARRWWAQDPEFDRSIRERFGPLHASVARGERAVWLLRPRGRLATVIVLDQFSRNIFRGTGRMFAFDEHALHAALDGIARGDDKQLALDERIFLYMPLMHCEDLADQERCVELFAAWASALQGEPRRRVEVSLDFARQHRDIIRRFGRFPHRNVLLGRPSTAAEIDFLQQPGSSF